MTKLDNQDRAAQLWCLPQHGNKEMDVDFAQSIAQALDAAEQRGRDEVLLEPCREGAPKDSAGVDRYPCHCCLKCKLSEAEAKHLNRESELLKTITKERTIALDSQARLAEMEKVLEVSRDTIQQSADAMINHSCEIHPKQKNEVNWYELRCKQRTALAAIAKSRASGGEPAQTKENT